MDPRSCKTLYFEGDSTGVVEWWSKGVMQKLFIVESLCFSFSQNSSTPRLQYSKTAEYVHRKNL
jgi:hypothetical protein